MNDNQPDSKPIRKRDKGRHLRLVRLVGKTQHPWKEGEARNVYEFPITRKILVEADESVSLEDVRKMALRVHDSELAVEILGGQYRLTLSLPNADMRRDDGKGCPL